MYIPEKCWIESSREEGVKKKVEEMLRDKFSPWHR